MKVVILAGGFGTRLSEETHLKPKPMVEIGGRPILWHIMKHHARHGFREFVIALGYKGDVIKRFFLDYRLLDSALTVDLATGDVATSGDRTEDWLVHLVDTGIQTGTGAFLLTYGDGVSDVDLTALVEFHRSHGRLATVTAVRPPARFGGLRFQGDLVAEFTEKPQIGEGWINGGFMVFEPGVLRYLDDDDTSLEAHALERLALDRQLAAYRHDGFWQCMDTLRDVRLLESLWEGGKAPWKVWH
jgi:glucose-1-phosphate cytidylyltransferase